MPVVVANQITGWTGADGKPVVVLAGPAGTPVTDADWALFKETQGGKAMLANGSVRVESKLSAAVALAIAPAADILRLAAEQDGGPTEAPAVDQGAPKGAEGADAPASVVEPKADAPATHVPSGDAVAAEPAKVTVTEPKPAPAPRPAKKK